MKVAELLQIILTGEQRERCDELQEKKSGEEDNSEITQERLRTFHGFI